MRPRVAIAAAVLVGAAAFAAWWWERTPDVVLEKKLVPHAEREATPMCPWRFPERDLARFFPGHRSWRQDTLVLSPHRLEILGRLGPGAVLESNALYLYRIDGAGSVLVRRLEGEYGAIEVVVAVGPDRRVVGLRVQRHREPPATARLIESPSFAAAFRGKGAADPLPQSHPGIARAVRSLLIELDVAEGHTRPS